MRKSKGESWGSLRKLDVVNLKLRFKNPLLSLFFRCDLYFFINTTKHGWSECIRPHLRWSHLVGAYLVENCVSCRQKCRQRAGLGYCTVRRHISPTSCHIISWHTYKSIMKFHFNLIRCHRNRQHIWRKFKKANLNQWSDWDNRVWLELNRIRITFQSIVSSARLNIGSIKAKPS